MMYVYIYQYFIDSSISFSNKQSATSITLTITCIGNVLRHLLLQPTHSIYRILVSYYHRHHHHPYFVFFHIKSVLFFLFFFFSLIISIHSSSLIHHLSFTLSLSSSFLFFFIPLYFHSPKIFLSSLSLSSSHVCVFFFLFFFGKTTVQGTTSINISLILPFRKPSSHCLAAIFSFCISLDLITWVKVFLEASFY